MKTLYNYKARDSYLHSKCEETEDKTYWGVKPKPDKKHSKHLQEFKMSQDVLLLSFHFFFPLFLEKQSCGAVGVPRE